MIVIHTLLYILVVSAHNNEDGVVMGSVPTSFKYNQADIRYADIDNTDRSQYDKVICFSLNNYVLLSMVFHS
jgi:hypothetical protein